MLQDNKEVLKEIYGYDVRNRMTKYTVIGKNMPHAAYGYNLGIQTYQYDALNNLCVVIPIPEDLSIETATYHYENTSDPTQLTSMTHAHSKYPSTVILMYDTEGCMVKDDAGRTLIYDEIGRLTGVSGEGISGGSYCYDAFNLLVS